MKFNGNHVKIFNKKIKALQKKKRKIGNSQVSLLNDSVIETQLLIPTVSGNHMSVIPSKAWDKFRKGSLKDDHDCGSKPEEKVKLVKSKNTLVSSQCGFSQGKKEKNSVKGKSILFNRGIYKREKCRKKNTSQNGNIEMKWKRINKNARKHKKYILLDSSVVNAKDKSENVHASLKNESSNEIAAKIEQTSFQNGITSDISKKKECITDKKFGKNGAFNNIGYIKQSSHLHKMNSSDSRSKVEKMELLLQRRSLPIFPVQQELIREAWKSHSIILIGETACGKTTQVPQFLYTAGVHNNGMIGITQPRRVAAITIAERVSLEMGVALGDLVGYSVRFDDMASEKTRIKYQTDGMLLRESISDPLLKRYNVIILDEAHERTLHTDVLFGIIKSAQTQRKRRKLHPLKIIVMSATMDVDHFSQYFNNAPVYYLEGRQYSVQIMYTIKEQEDYVFTALVTVFQIHQYEPEGDILVFCTGQEEIESMVKAVRETSSQLPFDCPPLIVFPLYAALPSAHQLKVFQPVEKGSRKVIFSTNIAETSITIPGIKYVVDTGMVKARTYHPGSGLDLLKVQKISKAQAWQRAGRAGREMSGVCYRLYTKQEYESLKEHSIPEIQRCNLASVILQLLAIGIKDVEHFDFMDKPSPETVSSALLQLQLLSAVQKEDSCWKLTSQGKQMALFPLEPRFAKVIFMSKEFGCTEEILTIISLLSVESVIFVPSKKRETAVEVHKKFQSNEGDHIMLMSIYKSFKNVKGNKKWCTDNFVHHRNLLMAVEVRKQLSELCKHVGIPLKSCGQDTARVRKCLAYGLFLNAAELQREGGYNTLDTRQRVAIHPSSCLFMNKPAYVVFTELIQTSKCYMRYLSIVDPDWLLEAAPNYFRQKRLYKVN